MIPILILAAGASTRMGHLDKLLEPVDGIAQLRRLCIEAGQLGGEVFVALPPADNPRARPRQDVINDLGVTVLHIEHADEGMGATMREAVKRLPPCSHFMVVLGDLVEITRHEIRKVLEALETNPDTPIVRGATTDGAAGHPIVFHNDIRKGFAQLGGDSGGEELVRPLIGQTVLVRLPNDAARCDLDTPEDWALWRARTGR